MSNRKRSRSGKKKKSVYLERAKAEKRGELKSDAELEQLRKNRRLHIFSLVLLVLAMVGLLVAPRLEVGSPAHIAIILAAYTATFVAGTIMYVNVIGDSERRRRTNKIIALIMMLLGSLGLITSVIAYIF